MELTCNKPHTSVIHPINIAWIYSSHKRWSRCLECCWKTISCGSCWSLHFRCSPRHWRWCCRRRIFRVCCWSMYFSCGCHGICCWWISIRDNICNCLNSVQLRFNVPFQFEKCSLSDIAVYWYSPDATNNRRNAKFTFLFISKFMNKNQVWNTNSSKTLFLNVYLLWIWRYML